MDVDVAAGSRHHVHILERAVGCSLRGEQTAAERRLSAVHPTTHPGALQALPMSTHSGLICPSRFLAKRSNRVMVGGVGGYLEVGGIKLEFHGTDTDTDTDTDIRDAPIV